MHPVVHKFHHHAKRHYHERYKKPHGVHAHIILTVDGILVAIIIALLAMGSYFAFVYNPLRDTFGMHFAEMSLVSGGKAEVALTIENKGDTRLSDVDIDVFFPPQFRVLSQATETDHAEVEVAAIPSEAEVTYRFQGLLLGPAGEAPVFARMRATDGFGSADERIIRGLMTWNDNHLKVEWDIPSTVLSGQDIPLTLTLRNISDVTLKDSHLAVTFPDAFRVRLATPPFTNNTIALGEFRPGDELKIVVLGSFPQNHELSSADFKAQLFLDEGAVHTLVAQSMTSAAVISVDIHVRAIFDESLAYALPGDTVGFRIEYANNSTHALSNLKLRLPLDIRVADLTNSVAELGGRAGASLGWESVTLPELEEIAPGDTGSVQGTVKLLTNLSKFSTDPYLELAPEAVFSIDTFDVADARLFGAKTSMKVAGRMQAAGVARYYTNEGDQIGRGPLPPRVGASTRYWVVLKAETGATEVRNARMVISLPAHVKWTGKASVTAGFEVYEANGGTTLIWNIGTIIPHTGTNSPALNTSLELAFTPTSSEIDLSPKLISGATLTGTDTWTGLNLSSPQGALSIELPTDPFIKGRTTVRE